MPAIKQYVSPEDALRPTETGIDAVVRAASRAGGFYDAAAAATERVGHQNAAAVGEVGQQNARAVEQVGKQNATWEGEVGRQNAEMVKESIKGVGAVAVDFLDHTQISHGAAAFASFTEQKTRAWEDKLKGYTDADGTVHPPADPNDPTVGQKFMSELEPELAKFKESFWTEKSRNWAESHIEQMRAHFGTKVNADMGTLAADAVSVNYKTTMNSLSNTAMMNPDAVPSLINQAKDSIGAIVSTSPNLRGVAASSATTKLTESTIENIVKAGAIGAIQKAADPEAEAQKWGEKYPQYINGQVLKQLGTEAKRQSRADSIADRRDKQLQNEERKIQSDESEVGYLQKLYHDDPKEQAKVNPKAIVNDPTLTRESKERLVNIVNRELKPESAAQASNTAAMDLLQRIRAPDGSPDRINNLDEIYKARTDGPLNKSDFEMLRKEFSDVRTPEGERLSARKNEFLKAAQPSIDGSNPLMGKIDKDGKLNSYRLMVDLDNKIAEYRKAGKNPYDLLDPSKPDFMGTPAALQPYQKPLQDSIRDQARKLTGGSRNLTGPGTTITGIEVTDAPVAAPAAPKIIPRKPNESPADYLKRTGS